MKLRRREARFRAHRWLFVSVLALLLAGCDAAFGVLAPGAGVGGLRSGLYSYRAWSDYDDRGALWWGYLELRVEHDGALTGSYRLPRQCADAYGYEADCVGRIGGRLYPDGTLRFGFDEGWLRNQGSVLTRSRASGYWEVRLLGYRDQGTFELVPY